MKWERIGSVVFIWMLFLSAGLVAAQEEASGPLWSSLWVKKGDTLSLKGFETDIDSWHLHVGGRFAVDAIRYSYANARRSGVEFDAAQLVFEGAYKDRFRFRIEPDLMGVDTTYNLFQAWGSWKFCEAAEVTAGLIRVALGSEFATPQEDFPLIGYSFTSYLDGRYDWGARLDGEVFRETFWYELTGTVGSGFNVDGKRLGSPQLSVRMIAKPFQFLKLPALNGLFLGGSFAFSPGYDDPITLTTPFDSTVFTTPKLDGGKATWLHLEIGWHWGPVRLGAEQILGAVDDVPVGGGHEIDMDQLTSWVLYGAWNITGETTLWRRGRWQPVGAPKYGFGRFEVGSRYSNADIDRRLFTYGITGYNPSTQEVRTFTLNLNWYPMEGLRLSAGWVKTIADHELSTFGDTNRDSSFILRLELDL